VVHLICRQVRRLVDERCNSLVRCVGDLSSPEPLDAITYASALHQTVVKVTPIFKCAQIGWYPCNDLPTKDSSKRVSL
jgi:hypothetical protein